ncbi:MAG: family 16 glycosylhydrolase [Pseudomonadota bacterium]
MAGRYGRPKRGQLGFWLGLSLVVFVGTLALSMMQYQGARGFSDVLAQPAESIGPRISQPAPEGASFVSWFGDGHDNTHWYRSDFDNEDHFMQVGWAANHLDFRDEAVHLWLTDRPSETNPYTSAEYQKRGRYGFGRYEVIMKAAEGEGLVSSFFTHIGPYFGAPHDEIDIEFLGKDTTKVYLTWFKNGEKGPERWHQLPFDAAKDYHLYAFEWTPETIRWFADGALIYERPDNALAVPATPGRIIMNLWTGLEAQYGWHGDPNFGVADKASYLCVSYQAQRGGSTAQCSDGWQSRTPSATPPYGADFALP